MLHEPQYLTPSDPDAFLDMHQWFPYLFDPSDPLKRQCPTCKGYAGWNLKLNAYGLGKHYQRGCYVCQGQGFVYARPNDILCEHSWIKYRKLGNCYEEKICTKCNTTIRIDTSS